MPNKTVTLRDVAARARVSSTTASVVLGDRGPEFRIASETIERVRAAAEQLGYRSPGGRRRRNRTALWSVFVPSDVDVLPARTFLDGVSAFLEERQIAVTCALVVFERGHLRDKLRWMSPDVLGGAVLVGLDDEDVAFVESGDVEIPVVLYNRTARNVPSVMVDELGVGHMAATHFLARGIDRFVVAGPTLITSATSLRLAGFSGALVAAGDALRPEISLERVVVGDDQALDMDRLVAASERRGVFVLTDTLLPAVMASLESAGADVPASTEVIAYGNGVISGLLHPSVTTATVPMHAMGKECAATLDRAVRQPGPSRDARRVFQAEMVFRDSSPAVP
ncbi:MULTISPECIES: LacI family DNA-binding transcriptional regulator [unclassified Curtobacterium]|uniref:LacI family DNA-binding transcriptional regulator n=1 Tax=unclassified Curtobacterium TaxID=257496 RepID=UPI003A813381